MPLASEGEVDGPQWTLTPEPSPPKDCQVDLVACTADRHASLVVRGSQSR